MLSRFYCPGKSILLFISSFDSDLDPLPQNFVTHISRIFLSWKPLSWPYCHKAAEFTWKVTERKRFKKFVEICPLALFQ